MGKTAVIIQARVGSTRFPSKITKKFHTGESLLDIQIKAIKKAFEGMVILAIPASPENQILRQLAKKHSITCYAGSEADVRSRFIEAANLYDIEIVVRICSDNPFINTSSIGALLALWKEGFDYLSYVGSNGKPAILQHWGVYPELVSLKALERASQLFPEDLYREHVTNAVHQHADKFQLQLVPVPEGLNLEPHHRFTIDTERDFIFADNTLATIKYMHDDEALRGLIEFVDSKSLIIESMKDRIKENSK